MDLGDVVARLDPLQQQTVRLVYLHGCTTADAAVILAVEQRTVVAALAAAFRPVARWVFADAGTAELPELSPS